jgi:hypothetical protein
LQKQRKAPQPTDSIDPILSITNSHPPPYKIIYSSSPVISI